MPKVKQGRAAALRSVCLIKNDENNSQFLVFFMLYSSIGFILTSEKEKLTTKPKEEYKVKNIVKKDWVMVLLVIVLVLFSCEVFAESVDPYAAQREAALTAMKVSLPAAEVDYVVRERDDRRYEWNIFYVQGEQFGMCKVLEETDEVRRIELFTPPVGALRPSEAMAKLAAEKGEMEIIDLKLDWDDGYLTYEGEAVMNERRYEFEMDVDGSFIEWERD